ncbi:Vacuolar protein-sorting-associated protein [Drechslerella dactyloides]|uniref:ESCRT-II complex subunit VPS25 n=1 Tax=Drechslerella dactyloides TaxID=74499 RepID=A0AAD6NI43_DREDA|nr:Vacuolar protein-sorting-associated protein [Drechslerella dactyloides]
MADSALPGYYPEFYSFPPFFTRQPNAASWSSQLVQWRAFILAYCRAHKLWRLNLLDALDSPLFHNKAINRKLPLPVVREIITDLTATSNAEWTSPDKSAAYIFWRTPDDFATLLYTYIDDTGQKGTVLTLHELTDGDNTTDQEWYGMEQAMLVRCLNVLVKRGVAQVFSVGDDKGVKVW